jgi:hypothetical protein
MSLADWLACDVETRIMAVAKARSAAAPHAKRLYKDRPALLLGFAGPDVVVFGSLTG